MCCKAALPVGARYPPDMGYQTSFVGASNWRLEADIWWVWVSALLVFKVLALPVGRAQWYMAGNGGSSKLATCQDKQQT